MSSAGLFASKNHGNNVHKGPTADPVSANQVQFVQKDFKTEQKIKQRTEQLMLEKKQDIAEEHLLRLLFWNICWECMASDKTSENDRAGKSAEEGKAGRDTCLENVCALIDGFGKLDIIGLQEATRIPDLQRKSEILKGMKSVVFSIPTKSSTVQIATFYNNSKLILIGAVCGNLDPTGEDARPYQIIFFNYTLDDKTVLLIVINLHNGKQYNKEKKSPGFSKKEIEETLSKCLNNPDEPKKVMGYIPNDGNIMAISGETTIDNLYKQISGDITQVIALGDFNEGFSPFGIKLVGPLNPEKLLLTEKITEYKFQGGYILASLDFNSDYPLTFKIPPSTIKTQEHLLSTQRAVYAELKIPNLQDILKEIPEETKEETLPKKPLFSGFSFFPSSKTPQPKQPKTTTQEPSKLSKTPAQKPPKQPSKGKSLFSSIFGGDGKINESEEEYYKRKYLIYKRKYLELKQKK